MFVWLMTKSYYEIIASHFRFIQRKDVYVLPHFYGELAQNKFGEQLIQEQVLCQSIRL